MPNSWKLIFRICHENIIVTDCDIRVMTCMKCGKLQLQFFPRYVTVCVNCLIEIKNLEDIYE